MAEDYEHRLSAEDISSEEDSEADSLSSFFERFTFKGVDADVALKLKKRSKDVNFSAKCTLDSPRLRGLSRPDWTFSARPADPYKNWKTRTLNKVAVNPLDRTVTWSMAKLRYKWFQWKVGVQFDLAARKLLWRYRVTSKWNTDGTKAYRKEKLALANKVLLQPHYTFDFQLPALEGGNDAAAEVEQPEFHFEVSRVDLVINAEGTSLTPFWKRETREQPVVPLLPRSSPITQHVIEGRNFTGPPRSLEIPSSNAQEASELWVTEQPESGTETVAPVGKSVAKVQKSHRPIPWCLDNPFMFPWVRPAPK